MFVFKKVFSKYNTRNNVLLRKIQFFPKMSNILNKKKKQQTRTLIIRNIFNILRFHIKLV